MLERKKPFRKIRVAEDICRMLEVMKKEHGYRGSFNSFIENELAQLPRTVSSVKGLSKQMDELTIQLKKAFEKTAFDKEEFLGYARAAIDLALHAGRAPGETLERIKVHGIRPRKDHEREQQQTA